VGSGRLTRDKTQVAVPDTKVAKIKKKISDPSRDVQPLGWFAKLKWVAIRGGS
jgi:hypothetical protein